MRRGPVNQAGFRWTPTAVQNVFIRTRNAPRTECRRPAPGPNADGSVAQAFARSRFPHHRPGGGPPTFCRRHLWRERDGRVGRLGRHPCSLVMRGVQLTLRKSFRTAVGVRRNDEALNFSCPDQQEPVRSLRPGPQSTWWRAAVCGQGRWTGFPEDGSSVAESARQAG